MLGLAVLLVALDQWLKQWAQDVLMPQGSMAFIPGVLGFRYAENAGAAFGIMQGGRWFFIALTAVVLVGIALYEYKLPRTKKNLWVRVPLLLIVSGAAGNFIDRLLFGRVVDMLEFQFVRFPIFNLADVFLVVGTALYIFAVFFVLKKDTPSSKNA